MFGVFAYYYVKYDRIIERRIKGPIFASSARIYARPEVIRRGEQLSLESSRPPSAPRRIPGADRTDRAGRSASRHGKFPAAAGGRSRYTRAALSYHSTDAARIDFLGQTVDNIVALGNNSGPDPGRLRARARGADPAFRGRTAHQAPVGEVRRPAEEPGQRGHRHRRPALLPAQRGELPAAGPGGADRSAGRRAQAGRIDHHHAALARVLPDAGEADQAQADRDPDRHRAGAEAQQAADLRDVRQPGRPGPARARTPSAASARARGLSSPKTSRT